MSFERLPEDLEGVLSPIVEKAKGSSNGYVYAPWSEELGELHERGMLSECEPCYDGNASVKLSSKGKRYFEEKKDAMKSSAAMTAKGIVGKVADKAIEAAVTAGMRNAGM